MLTILISYISCILFHILPAYYTYREALAPTADGTKKWLTFWIVHTVFNSFELLGDLVLARTPLYVLAKIVVVVWLLFRGGAIYIYEQWLSKLLTQYEQELDSALDRVTVVTADGFLAFIRLIFLRIQFAAAR